MSVGGDSSGDIYDVTIVGGGPTGLFAAFYAGLRQMKIKIIDSPQLGGQLAALYPEKYIYDVAGFPRVLAKDLVAYQVEQALQYDPTVCLEEKVTNVARDADSGILTVTTDRRLTPDEDGGDRGGVGAFMPRKLDVPRVEELVGKGIQYFVTDTSGFAGKRIVIVGGGDSAFDWALGLHEQAASCMLIHRSDRFPRP